MRLLNADIVLAEFEFCSASKLLPIIIYCCLFFHASYAQKRCWTGLQKITLAEKDTVYHLQRSTNQQPGSNRHNLRVASDDGKIYRIPVVVHVIWHSAASNISDEVINSQIKVLNDDFRRLNADTVNTFDIFKPVVGDAKFEFFLAGIDPQSNTCTGIVRKYTSQSDFYPDGVSTEVKPLSIWPSDQYLNIWVTTLQSGFLGVGPDPEGAFNDTLSPQGDGIVIDYTAFGVNNISTKYHLGRTVTHEVGHWVGLSHLWGDDDFCGDDYVTDTPTQSSDGTAIKACEKSFSKCSNYSGQDMSGNYMVYSPDACMNLFTKGQISRMRFVMETNTARIAIQNSPALGSITGTMASYINKSLNIYPNPSNGTISFRDNIFNSNNLEIIIFDRLGKEVLSLHELSSQKQGYDVSALPNGMYLVRVVSGQQAYKSALTVIK